MDKLDPAFPKLLAVCKKIYIKARELIPYSANKPSLHPNLPPRDMTLALVRKRNPELTKYKELFSQLNLFLGDDKTPDGFYEKRLTGTFDGMNNPSMRELHDKIKSFKSLDKSRHKDGVLFHPKHKIESSSKKAIRFGIGNCGEIADLTYSLLLEFPCKILKSKKIRIERMSCSRGDHGFVVVNRREGSKASDLSTWGPDALIVDAWDGDIMYAETGVSALKSKRPRYYDYYDYIKSRTPYVDTSGFIGEGLSGRFHKHAREKNRPHRFFSWDAKYTGNKRMDKRRELTHIPIDLQDEPPITSNKRRGEELEQFDLTNKKMKMYNTL